MRRNPHAASGVWVCEMGAGLYRLASVHPSSPRDAQKKPSHRPWRAKARPFSGYSSAQFASRCSRTPPPLHPQVVRHIALPPQHLRSIADAMADEMAAGLAAGGPGAAASSCLMLPTRVDLLPDGHERGEYFALELGGTGTLRLLFARLSETRRGETDALDLEEVRLDPALKSAPVEDLFDFLAARLAAFVRRCGWDVASRGPPLLGFCFSFPVHQTDRTSGTLVRWTKGFACPGAVGRDVSALLAEACTRAGLPIAIGALVNDTVGALAAARYSDGDDAVVSLVLNAGTNAAYVELLSHIEKFYAGPAGPGGSGSGGASPSPPSSPAHHPPGLPRTSDLVVNIEWRGFADALLPTLPDDEEGEEEGGEAGEHGGGAFERLTGPLYLGEAARRLIARLATAGAWFVPAGASVADPAAAARATAGLATPGVLDFTQVCRAAADCSPDLRHVAEELGDALGVPPSAIPPSARPEVRDACAALLRRSARLTAAGLGGVIAHLASEAASRPDVSLSLDLATGSGGGSGGDGPAGASVFGGYGPGGGARFDAGQGGEGAVPRGTLPPLSVPLPPQRRFVIAAEGAMLRRGGRFIDELRAGLDDVLGAELASRVCVRVVEGGAGFGAAALAAAAHTQAVAMGSVDSHAGPRNYFTFPPRATASTPLAPPAAAEEQASSRL